MYIHIYIYILTYFTIKPMLMIVIGYFVVHPIYYVDYISG